LDVSPDKVVKSFLEKPKGDGAWINGGFFVCEPEVFSYIDGDDTTWERSPMETLAAQNQMMAFRHEGFWKPMDTLRDKLELETAWNSGQAEWKIW
jgi:glucose-1-phosphate cytidylyltransferase